jgi:CubicO group peptidase (beta-lactamase class C family)
MEKPQNDWTTDTFQWIASMTKVPTQPTAPPCLLPRHRKPSGNFSTNTPKPQLITATATLQLVSQGKLSLDEPVSTYLSATVFTNPQILTAYDTTTSTPTLEPAPRAPTLRELLTHSSGITYHEMHPLLGAYWSQTLKRGARLNDSISYSFGSNPLVFSPGEGWLYGAGLDWTGQIIEAVTGQRLHDYFAQHIFAVLPDLHGAQDKGMQSTTFTPMQRPDLLARLSVRPMRDPDSGKLVKDTTSLMPVRDAEDDWGGSGLFSTANDYVRVLRSLLLDDGKLLASKWRDELLRPEGNLSAEATAALEQVTNGPFGAFLTPGYCVGGEKQGKGGEAVRYSYGLGGCTVVNEGGIEGLADKGLMFWSGFPNCHWVSFKSGGSSFGLLWEGRANLGFAQFIDQGRGIAGVYAAHLLMPGDVPTSALFRQWHEAIYAMVGSS